MGILGWRTLAATGLVAWLAAAGCTLVLGDLQECADDDNCGDGLACVDGLCVSPPPAPAPEYPEGCAPLGLVAPEQAPIVIGILLPLTNADGNPEGRGKARLQAMQLALEEINSREGTGTRQLDALVCDTTGDADRARAQGAAVAQRGIPAILGPASSREVLAVSSQTIQAGVVVVSPSATSPEITGLPDQNLVWRTAPSDAVQGQVIADLLGVAPPARVAGIVLNDPYGDGLWRVFDEAWAGETHRLLYDRDGSVDAAVAQAEDFGPDLLLVVAFPSDAIRILDGRAANPALAAARLFFTDSAKSEDVILGVADSSRLEGAHGTAPAAPANESFDNFVERYASRWNGEDPKAFSFTAHSYDAAYVLALAISWAEGRGGELTGAQIAQGLARLSDPQGQAFNLRQDELIGARTMLLADVAIDIEGASGKLDFDANGESPSQVEEWEIQGGQFRTVGFHEPSR